nr:nadh-ubiquinone oxidoreductase 10.5 kda subunit [Quercus suber]
MSPHFSIGWGAFELSFLSCIANSAEHLNSEMSGKYIFAKGLKELRFLHCQTSEHSNAVRSFLTRAYPTMKHHNPHTPIMIREAAGIEPRVYARYEFGRETMADLKGEILHFGTSLMSPLRAQH